MKLSHIFSGVEAGPDSALLLRALILACALCALLLAGLAAARLRPAGLLPVPLRARLLSIVLPSSRRTLLLRADLPPALAPQAVVESLHGYAALFRHQPLVAAFFRRPVDAEAAAREGDFFQLHQATATATATQDEEGDGIPAMLPPPPELVSYTVVEKIPVVPWLGDFGTTMLTFPALLQAFEHGVRSRVAAPSGVSVWIHCGVFPKVGGLGPAELKEEVKGGGGEYELVETIELECPAVLMPFVYKTTERAHRANLESIIADCVEKQTIAAARTRL